VDFLLIGGGMAANFLKVKSFEIGNSLFESDILDTAARLLEKASRNGVRLILPVDVVVADDSSANSQGKVVTVDNIPPDKMIVDIGSQTLKNFYEELRRCKTVFWNGPMGVYEVPQFGESTRAIAKLLASIGAITIVGGGSTAEIVTNMGLADKMSFVSTGGGATLQFLGGQSLPGVEALLDKSVLAKGKIKGLVA
jgi:phosphoglycerate kinase